MPKQISLCEEDIWRANTYSLLARLLYSPPDRNLLDSLAAAEPSSAEDAAPLYLAWSRLALAAKQASPEALSEEFQDLFIGMTRCELLPYASYYLTGFLMEKPLALLRVDLSRLGLQRRHNVHEPEDHVAALCEVMCLLIQENRPEQAGFFQAHIAPWLDKFMSYLEKAESADFYQAVALVGRALFTVENTYLLIPS